MAKKPAPARAAYNLNIGAAVAYEAVRQLRIQSGNRDDVAFEFLDNSHRKAVLDKADQFRGRDPKVDPEDIEALIYQRIINLLC